MVVDRRLDGENAASFFWNLCELEQIEVFYLGFLTTWALGVPNASMQRYKKEIESFPQKYKCWDPDGGNPHDRFEGNGLWT